MANIVIRWKGADAIGFLVIHRTVNNVSSGAVSISASCTEGEIVDAAAAASLHFASSSPQLGGARAGIRFDPQDPRAESVLREFVRFLAVYIKTIWIPTPGSGVDEALLDRVVIEEAGVPNRFVALSAALTHSAGIPDLSSQLAWIPDHPAVKSEEFGTYSIREVVVGFGAAEVLRLTIQTCGVENPGVAIHGFGNNGAALAWYIHERGIAKVVGILDVDGYIVNPEGIDVKAVFAARQKKGGKDVTLFNALSGADGIAGTVQAVTGGTNKKDEENLINFLKACGPSAQIFCPSAGSFKVTEEVARKGLILIWGRNVGPYKRIIVPATPKPYGKFLAKDGKDVVEDVDMGERLHKGKGTVAIPDWVSCLALTQLTHTALGKQFDREDPATAENVLATAAGAALSFMNEAGIATVATQCFTTSANRLATERVANPTTFTGLKPSQAEVRAPAAASAAAAGGADDRHPSQYALPPPPVELRLPLEERIRLCRNVAAADELINDDELVALLTRCQNPVAYDGFEPSGRMHIAQGVRKAILVNRLTKSGFTFLFWVADYFAMLNHKMGGDLKKIRRVGQYFVEVWKATGMDMSRVRFLWCSEEYSKRGDEFWRTVLEMSTRFNISRVKRCCQIMGRSEGDDLSASQILYPMMQAADIFLLGVDVCQLGVDQRKVNMLAREFCDEIKPPMKKPIIMSHGMMPGLKEHQAKMSKSDPSSAIFMEDSKEEVESKIKKAFCPPNQVEPNPCLDYMRDVVFAVAEDKGTNVLITRSEENGGDVEYKTFAEFRQDYADGKLHPGDVKANLSRELNTLIEPVRRHFVENAEAAAILDDIRRWQKEAEKAKGAAAQ